VNAPLNCAKTHTITESDFRDDFVYCNYIIEGTRWKCPFLFQNVRAAKAVIHLRKVDVCTSLAISVGTSSAVVVWRISNEERLKPVHKYSETFVVHLLTS
jgi:hypothetical protein